MFPEGLENTPFKVIGHVTSSVLVMGETNVPGAVCQIQLASGQKFDHRMYLKCPWKVILIIYFKVICFEKMHFKILHIKDAVSFHAFLQHVS